MIKSRNEASLTSYRTSNTEASRCCAYAIMKVGLYQSQKRQVPRGWATSTFLLITRSLILYSGSPCFEFISYTCTIPLDNWLLMSEQDGERGGGNEVPQPRERAAQASVCSFVLKRTSEVLRAYSIYRGLHLQRIYSCLSTFSVNRSYDARWHRRLVVKAVTTLQEGI